MSFSLEQRHALFGGHLTCRQIVALKARWLTCELVPPGLAAPRRRLRTWAANGCPRPSESGLSYMGDAAIASIVQRVLQQLPDPVVDFIVAHVLVVGVGRETNGWFAQAPRLPRCPDESLRLVALAGQTDDAELEGVAAHEMGHAWLSEPNDVPLSGVVRAPARGFGVREFVALPRAERARAAGVAITLGRLEEERVARLARAWGFLGAATDDRRCGEYYERKKRAELEALGVLCRNG